MNEFGIKQQEQRENPKLTWTEEFHKSLEKKKVTGKKKDDSKKRQKWSWRGEKKNGVQRQQKPEWSPMHAVPYHYRDCYPPCPMRNTSDLFPICSRVTCISLVVACIHLQVVCMYLYLQSNPINVAARLSCIVAFLN